MYIFHDLGEVSRTYLLPDKVLTPDVFNLIQVREPSSSSSWYFGWIWWKN